MGSGKKRVPRSLADNVPSSREEMVAMLNKYKNKRKKNKKILRMIPLLEQGIISFDEKKRKEKENADAIKEMESRQTVDEDEDALAELIDEDDD